MSTNSFGAKARLEVGGRSYEIFRLDALQSRYDVARLPFSLKILLENLLRNEDGESVRPADIEALASWDAKAEPTEEIAFTPARVVMQDFTGVPAIVDLAAMRDAMREHGRRPREDQPAGAGRAGDRPLRAGRRVRLHGGVPAQRRARVRAQPGALRVPALGPDGVSTTSGWSRPTPGSSTRSTSSTWRASCSSSEAGRDPPQAYPDTLVGTDSHTTMINGLGVLGWGVGGIEAEAAMLGQPMSMLIPQVVGFKLHGELPEGATATDLVLTVTEMLRKHGVVGKFVEFYGAGLANLPLADRATIGNMSPEFGSTCAIFPIDAETLRYLEFTGRPRRADRARRALRQGAGSVARRATPRSRRSATRSSSI